MGRVKGFTLVELTIVIVIIMIIAAITIPQMLRSKMSAEETSAIASLRTIATAQIQVVAESLFPDPATGVPMYATFEQLQSLDPPLLDSVLTGGDHVKSGFEFSIDLVNQTPQVADFTAYALVIRQGTNIRSMLIDQSGVIHFTTDGSIPNINSPTL